MPPGKRRRDGFLRRWWRALPDQDQGILIATGLLLIALTIGVAVLLWRAQ